MKTANFTEFRQNLRAYLDRVINDTDTVVINNAMKETEYIMQSPATMEAIQRASDELDNGKSLKQKDGETVEDFLARI